MCKDMTEEEKKLEAGEPYDFTDPGVDGRKMDAVRFCRGLRQMQDRDDVLECPAKFLKTFSCVARV